MYYPTKGEVISVPGLPKMYDYEFDTERPPVGAKKKNLYLVSDSQ